MRMVLVLLASLMLATSVLANGNGSNDHHNCVANGKDASACNTTVDNNTYQYNDNDTYNYTDESNTANGGTGVGVGVGIGEGGDANANVFGSGNSDTDVDVDNTNFNTNIAQGGEGGDGGNAFSHADGGNAFQGQDQGQLQGQQQGQSSENSNVNEGNNTEVIVTIGEDGTPLTASSQTVEGDSLVVEGDTTTYEAPIIPEAPVSSVAPSFSAICSSGGAGQGRNFALSLAVTNDVCQALMIADAYMALGEKEEALKWVKAAARHAGWKGGLGYIRHLVTLGIL